MIDWSQVKTAEQKEAESQAALRASLTAAIQERLDTTAQARSYDGIVSLCSYVTSTDPVFAAEGRAGVEWRDAAWRYAYQVLGEVQAGTRAIPSEEELLAGLPAIVWPEPV